MATSIGIVALLVASAPSFLAVKYAGAAYLVWLGFQALRQAIRPSAKGGDIAPALTSAKRLTAPAAFRQGVLSDLGNPKMAVFFASLLPQFAPSGATFADLLPLGIVFAVMTLVWLAFYAAIVAKVGDVLRSAGLSKAQPACCSSASACASPPNATPEYQSSA